MANTTKGRTRKTGLPPGTLIHTGQRRMETPRITVIEYSKDTFRETEIKDVKECPILRDTPAVAWINVAGLHDVDLLRQIGDAFGIHRLVLEDILATDQRPKMEDYQSYLYTVFKMLSYDEEKRGVAAEQVSLILGPNFVISFQEREEKIFEPVRETIKLDKGVIRRSGPDYLVYALLDVVVDHYFLVLEKMGEAVDVLSDAVLIRPEPAVLRELHQLRRELLFLHRAIWPLREVIAGLSRRNTELVREGTAIYLRDVYDHTVQMMDTVDIYREMMAGAMDIYLSSVSNRLNQVMKVLTVIATIFIPLTFLAGV